MFTLILNDGCSYKNIPFRLWTENISFNSLLLRPIEHAIPQSANKLRRLHTQTNRILSILVGSIDAVLIAFGESSIILQWIKISTFKDRMNPTYFIHWISWIVSIVFYRPKLLIQLYHILLEIYLDIRFSHWLFIPLATLI